MAEDLTQSEKPYTKKELADFLELIDQRLNSSDDSYMHSILAFNHILRQPNASELLDEPMRKSARDIWAKIKSMGIMLGEPPLLFGLPEDKDESH